MPDAQPTPDIAERVRQSELAILYTLTKPKNNPHLWTDEELAREAGEDRYYPDAIERLYGAGLIHRTADGFILGIIPLTQGPYAILRLLASSTCHPESRHDALALIWGHLRSRGRFRDRCGASGDRRDGPAD